MTLSWKELVFHGLLKKVGDLTLAKELLKGASVNRLMRLIFFPESSRPRFFSSWRRPNYNMTLSWKELVFHGLLKKVGDPSLAKELLKVAMKEHRDLLDEEAREFQSEFVNPVVGVYCFHSRVCCWRCCCPIINQEFERDRYSPSPVLSPKTWLTAIRYNNVKKELIYS